MNGYEIVRALAGQQIIRTTPCLTDRQGVFLYVKCNIGKHIFSCFIHFGEIYILFHIDIMLNSSGLE
jgi:hypothetical protein